MRLLILMNRLRGELSPEDPDTPTTRGFVLSAEAERREILPC